MKLITRNLQTSLAVLGLTLSTGIALALRFGLLQNQDLSLALQDFITLVLGITIEALPFLVIGVMVSVLVDLFVKSEWLTNLIPKKTLPGHMFMSILGIFLPVCECGNVPVVRRLIMAKVKPSYAMTFLLAAPIINPITFWATMEAFNFAPEVAFVRLGAAFVISIGIGMLIGLYPHPKRLLVNDFDEQTDACEHDHHSSKLSHGIHVFRLEFVSTARLLIFGAMIAAATQTFIPRDIIESVGSSPLLSVVAMILLAFVVSICANIDAFFALAYVNTFTLGSIMSFLVFGPMIDIKLLMMLRKTFKWQVLLLITILVTLSALLLGLTLNLIW